MSLFYKNIKIASVGYVLNLPERTDRKEKVDELLTSLGFSGYKFFNGTSIKDPELTKLGCTHSELKIFEDFLQNDYEDMVLFEDDIKLMSGVSLNDLDNIFSDWDSTTTHYDSIALGTKLLPRSEIVLQGKTHGKFTEMLCTQSFYYKRNIVEHIFENLSNYSNQNHFLYKCTIDMFLNDCTNEQYRFLHNSIHKTFRFGITIPMIFNQESGYSNIEKQNENYEQMIFNSFHNALSKKTKKEKGFVYYCNEKYLPIVSESIKILRKYTDLPVYVYTVNCSHTFNIENVFSIQWDVDVSEFNEEMYFTEKNNFFLKREDRRFYKFMIQRPLIVKDCLENYLETVAYLDSDSVVMPWIENFFNHYDINSPYPYFTECFYDFLSYNGVGEAASNGDYTKTLEHKVCQLLNVDQTIRTWYRQTGYFISSQNSIDFLDEWYWISCHPKILKNPEIFAPYHEETMMNVLLWSKKILSGLHLVYVNSTIENINELFEFKFNGEIQVVKPWFAVPGEFKHIYFLHGEKNPSNMSQMSCLIDKFVENI